MNLDSYRIFYYVAMAGSFTKAAELLHNNQPNIRRYINVLEAELGCRLFERGKKGVTLTHEGQHMLRYVTEAMEALEKGEKELNQMLIMSKGHISISASETAMRLLLLNKLADFQRLYPDVRINISNSSSPQAIAELENGSANLAVITTPSSIPHDMNAIPLCAFREILIAGPKYSAFTQSTYDLAELQKLPMISMGVHTGTRELYQQYYMKHGLTLQPEIECATSDQILQMVAANLGIGFYPEPLVKEALRVGRIYQIQLKEELPQRQVILVRPVREHVGLAGEKLVELLLEKKQS